MAQDNFDVNAILDGTLDDLADLPEFKPFAPGSYIVSLSIKDKTAQKDRINGHPGFEFKLKVQEVLELNDKEGVPPAIGDETSILYLLDNDIGQGNFKNLMKVTAEHFGAKSNRELLADLQGATVMVITKQRANKDKTKMYDDIVEMKVV